MSDKCRNDKGQFVRTVPLNEQRLYKVWCGMKRRCNCINDQSYSRYGAKGIKVCEEWNNSYTKFSNWSKANGYADGLTIDRIDNSKGYEPSNCRWVTTAIQNRNYSRNHNITYSGKTMCVADWSAETGINRATILFRLKQGKPLEEVFNKEDGRSKRWKTISQS